MATAIKRGENVIVTLPLFASDGSDRGNGSAHLWGLGGSHNNIDFVFTWEQPYSINGGRWELGNKFILATNNGAFSHIKVQDTTIHDYAGVNGNLIEIQGQTSLVVENSQFARTDGGKYASPILISSSGRVGALSVRQSSFTSDVIYTKPGNSKFDIDIRGNIKLGAGFVATDLFPNQ